MLADFFTKALQGSFFVKLHEEIMGWKHIDNLHMGPPSTKYRVGNMDGFESSKEVTCVSLYLVQFIVVVVYNILVQYLFIKIKCSDILDNH